MATDDQVNDTGRVKEVKHVNVITPNLPPGVLEKMTQYLMDQGLLIEAGFAALRKNNISPNAPIEQLNDLRLTFFAGAQHVFASIMHGLEEGDEPTPKDMERMNKIAEELRVFAEQFEAAQKQRAEAAARMSPTAGSA